MSDREEKMSSIKEYRFFRSFSTKIENWSQRKAEALWRKMREKKIAEIQAAEAMKWLREAGFPQYSQMYQDLQFPIDLSCVEKDHPFLEKDQLQALYRRLVILNRSATMRLDGQYSRNASNKRREDSDEDVCALSKNWTFQPEIRRWSRVGEMGPLSLNLPKGETSKTSSRESTPEEFELNVPHMNLVTANYLSVPPAVNSQATAQDSPQANNNSNNNINNNLKRSGSERLRDGAKNILRRVESIKSRRKKKKNREGVVISGPVHLDIMQLHEKFQNLSSSKDIKTCRSSTTSPLVGSPVNSSPTPLFLFADPKICPTTDSHSATMFGQHLSPYRKGHPASRTSPLHFFSTTSTQQRKQQQPNADDSSSLCSEVSLDSSNESAEKKLSPIGRYFHHHHKKHDDATISGAQSDTEACHVSRSQTKKKSSKGSQKANTIARGGGGSLNLGRDSNRYRENLKSRRIFRSRSAVRHSTDCNDNAQDVQASAKSSSVVRWHSFRATTNTKRDFNDVEGVSLCKLSCGQIEKLRKLALVTLTGYMERYCPTHRTGWNWELPKFIKKIKTPDYKDKKVFGVPFSVILQKTGHTLPKGIQAALTWLKINALDQVGIFRKSGVKSRIAKLKTSIDQTDENIIKIFEDQQAYDVADVVKQYFRDLPESLLTTKLCDTFVSIFQYLPAEVKFEALQSAILLLPDENREVLLMLLEFLHQVAAKSEYNQMSPNNLAVCLAPSIFQNGVHSNTPTASPRRKRATGVPDAKDLDANRASSQCLTYLIMNFKKVFFITCDKINRCNFSYMEESRPVTLEALGDAVQLSNWRSYLYECVKATIKEGREKSRGWISINSFDSLTEIYYRKVGDGHPLKLWKCVTEVDANPITIMSRITKERHLWDKQLLKMRVIEQLDSSSDVFQYACSSGHIVTDYCVLRTSCTDLPRGACVTVEISIEHPGAPLLLSGVRGVVLASRYLIEPIGNGKSRVMHLARVDTKGRTIEWYKNFGYICALNLARIRDGLKIK
ncbi:rho GTPase-activating protein 7 isoform X3 [Chironomus tepperi]|uniref:rho GTPase-activating protein 7 isoform X3 n=1 Tax=Chironomus tepperi TaxID=113505 RepID=UPI00391F3DC8